MAAGADAAMDRPLDQAVVQHAALWMARLWSDNASPEDQAACARWRAAHPDHELAWRRLQGLDDQLNAVPREVVRHVLRDAAPTKPAGRRRMLQMLSVAFVASGAAYAARDSDRWRATVADHRTATGEIRTITLPDDSQLVLASASAIDVQFTDDERLVVLRAGEVLITTAKDPSPTHRPFRVRSRHGMVQALGTRFTVRQEERSSHVAVFEGAVEVRPVHAPGQALRVASGEGVTFSADEAQSPSPVSDTAASWVNGVLVADNMRLDDLLEALGRYRSGVLRCDPAVAGLKVNGVFSLRDTDRALSNLVRALPVKVVARTRFWVTVGRAD